MSTYLPTFPDNCMDLYVPILVDDPERDLDIKKSAFKNIAHFLWRKNLK